MIARRAGQILATVLGTFLWMSCGQVYRPVVIPTQLTPPNPAGFHTVFAITGTSPFYPGTAMQIDVSGDSVIGETSNSPADPNAGVNPTYATILPNSSRVFVTSAGSVNPNVADVVTAFSPAVDSVVASGFGTVTTYSLPSGSLPVFVHTTQNTAVYIANYGTNSVSVINPSFNIVSNTVSVGTTGSQPVALAEIADGTKLYVVTQGDNTVRSLSTVDMSTLATFSVGTAPVWAVAREDGQRVYVVTQGDGNLYTLRTDTNALLSGCAQPGCPQTVGGAGANYAIYDNSRNRIYVVNPNVAAVFAFDATTDPPTPLGSAAGISVPAPAGVTGVGAVTPMSVAALPDGSRFYVASYVAATGACPDPLTASAGCIIPQATVFDAGTLTVKSNIFPLFSPVTTSSNTILHPIAAAPIASCNVLTPYAPTAARFRVSAATSADSTRAYIGMCDAGTIAVIDTATNSLNLNGSNATDTVVLDLNAPFSAGTGANGQPTLQNPLFLFTGQ